MDQIKTSYKQIIKATTLFGGVQFINIILSIIKSKFVAIILGTTGVGILTLLNSSLNLIFSITGFGLESSGIKNISTHLKNDSKLYKTISIYKYLIFITGLIGCLITLVFSSYLSNITFGNTDFKYAFIWLGLAVFFKQLSSGYLSILQSLRVLRLYAKANLYANIVSLCIVLPMYFYWEINAIAPSIMIATSISFALAYFYTKKVTEPKKIRIFNKNIFLEGKSILYLGLALSISDLFRMLSEYLVQIVISYKGTLNEVGLYGAGLIVLNTYAGFIFIVMSKNYFPRLSEIASNNNEIKKLAFHQAYLTILIITPIIILFIILAPEIIQLIFSSKFIPITKMVSWGILAMLFKTLSWTLGYIIITKGDTKLLIKTSVFYSVLYFVFLVLGYTIAGLKGIGVAFLGYFIVHFLGINFVVKYFYKINLSRELYIVFFKCSLLCIIVFLLSFLNLGIYKYILMWLVAVISIVYVLKALNNKVPLKDLMTSLLKNNR